MLSVKAPFFAANISRFWLERCFMFYKQSNRMCWVDPITPFSVTDWHFSQNDEARPQGPPPRLKGSAQRVLKLQFDPSMHTPSSILLHISAGIVSIHKCSDWREPTMPSVVVVNFWLRGPGLHGSGPRWGVGSEVEYLTFLRDDSLVTTPDAGARASFTALISCGNAESDLDDESFPAPSVSCRLHPVFSN